MSVTGSTTTRTTTGAQYLARAIADLAVARVYGVPGQRVLPLFHHLQNTEGVAVHLTRHEQGASFMADMDSRAGGLGVVITTSGAPRSAPSSDRTSSA